ncbi:WAP four-disulfide core domain protein 8-like isoform X1 [Pelobates fuscus]|uniref:WAP four-disulfide core domain protein 8-like isoform X1 n=1 Tax=Pelobates fuscus TaxID=191477 RepID=UPI002FE47129
MISANLIVLGLSLCFLGARATDPAEKPGSCPLDVDYPRCDSVNTTNPKNECRTDGDCKEDRKCCFSGCQNKCLLPLKDKLDSCRYYDASICIRVIALPSNCHTDEQCQGTDRCCCGCSRRCTSTGTVKSGFCPSKKSDNVAASEESLVKPFPKPKCQSDKDCSGLMKCCGGRCVTPIKEHAGFCPISNEEISCIISLDKPLCSTDADCKKNEKCCLSKSKNRLQCVPALKEKPGVCRVRQIFMKCLVPFPPGNCNSDRDCPGNKKCCYDMCQLNCRDV